MATFRFESVTWYHFAEILPTGMLFQAWVEFKWTWPYLAITWSCTYSVLVAFLFPIQWSVFSFFFLPTALTFSQKDQYSSGRLWSPQLLERMLLGNFQGPLSPHHTTSPLEPGDDGKSDLFSGRTCLPRAPLKELYTPRAFTHRWARRVSVLVWGREFMIIT